MAIKQTTDLLKLLASEEAAYMHNAAFDYAQKSLKPLNRQMDKEGKFPDHLWQEMGAIGMHGITIEEKYGGINAGYMTHMSIVEALSYYSGSVGLSYGANSNLCMNQIQLNGTDEQKQKFLPKLCFGKFHGGLAMSESGSGSDVISMQTKAVKCQGGYILNGEKMWITNGPTANVLVVYARTDEKALTAFLVEKEMDGFTPGEKIDKRGMRGSETAPLYFDNCFVPEANVLGQVNGGSKVLMSGLNYERLILASGPLGLAQSSFDTTLEYAKIRKQFGKPIIENQAYSHQLAKMNYRLQSVRNHVYMTAAQGIGNGRLANEAAAGALYMATETGLDITADCIRLCGGMGYTNDMNLAQNNDDMILYGIGAGTQEIRLEIMARALKNL